MLSTMYCVQPRFVLGCTWCIATHLQRSILDCTLCKMNCRLMSSIQDCILSKMSYPQLLSRIQHCSQSTTMPLHSSRSQQYRLASCICMVPMRCTALCNGPSTCDCQ